MASELRASGIDVVGDIAWGTHLCHFYETKADLLDILIPYFKTGLENNEYCLWVVADPLGEEDARNALRQAVPEADRYLAAGRIEIVPHTEWFFQDGTFVPERVLHGWTKKLAAALAEGYAGMRVNGNEAWLTKEQWKQFAEYEATLDAMLAQSRMIAVCSYPLSGASAADILDVARTHLFAVVRRHGTWEMLETPELKRAKQEVMTPAEERRQWGIGRTTRMPRWWRQSPVLLGYGLPVLLVMAAMGTLSWMEMAQDAPAHVSLFLFAVMLSAAVGGIGPSSLAAALSALAFDYYFLPPIHSLAMEGAQVPRLVLFGVSAVFVGLLTSAQRRAAELLRGMRDRLKNNNTVLQAEIIEHRQAEEALRESEARLQAAIEAANLGLWDWDLVSGRIIGLGHHNKLFGFGPGEFDGTLRSIEARIHPEDLEGFRRARESGPEYAREFRVVWPDGSIHWIAGMGRCTYSETGQPVRMYGAVRDITERKQAEEAVRESHQLLHLVLATLPVGVAVTDRAGDIVLINAASKRIWGGGTILSGRERWGQTKGFWHDSGERIAPTNWASVRALSEGQTSLNELIDIETYDGQQKTIRNSSAPIRNAEGLIVGAVIVNEDVTERVRAEEALRTTTEQLRALTARLQSVREEEGARIARELHDELGSALTSVKWELEGMEKLLAEAGSQTALSRLREKVKGMTGRIDSTINTVKRLSSELRPSILDDLGLLEAIEWQAQQFQARTGIVCHCACSLEDVHLTREQVTAVFRILQEALTNVLRHANATRVEVTVEEEAGEFVLTIRDNGRGIRDEEKSGPRSLGLLGMQERAQLVGGRIEVAGSPGAGTVVTVRVPVSHDQRPALAGPETRQGGGRP